MRKPRKPKETKTAITKEIIEDNDSSGDENKKSKSRTDKVNFKNKKLTLYFMNLYEKYVHRYVNFIIIVCG